jgi:hypothetical protein
MIRAPAFNKRDRTCNNGPVASADAVHERNKIHACPPPAQGHEFASTFLPCTAAAAASTWVFAVQFNELTRLVRAAIQCTRT